MQTRNCGICAKVLLQRQKFTCSPKCKFIWIGRKIAGKSSWNKGLTKADAPQLSNSGLKKGSVAWNKGKPLSEAHKLALRKKHKPLSEATKQKMRGRVPWNKIGDGITPINERIRKSPEYKTWRKTVFERDDYTCKECGKRGGNLNADHIKPFALYPELRFDVDNGRTLCMPCHRKTETFGINQHSTGISRRRGGDYLQGHKKPG